MSIMAFMREPAVVYLTVCLKKGGAQNYFHILSTEFILRHFSFYLVFSSHKHRVHFGKVHAAGGGNSCAGGLRTKGAEGDCAFGRSEQ